MEKATSDLFVPRADDVSEAALAACRAGTHGLMSAFVESEDVSAGTFLICLTCRRCGYVHRATYRRCGDRLVSVAPSEPRDEGAE